MKEISRRIFRGSSGTLALLYESDPHFRGSRWNVTVCINGEPFKTLIFWNDYVKAEHYADQPWHELTKRGPK